MLTYVRSRPKLHLHSSLTPMTYGTNDTRGRRWRPARGFSEHARPPPFSLPPLSVHRLSHQAERARWGGADDEDASGGGGGGGYFRRTIRRDGFAPPARLTSSFLSLFLSLFFFFFFFFPDTPAGEMTWRDSCAKRTWNRARYDCSSRLTAVKSRYIGAATGIHVGGRDEERRAREGEIKSNDNDKIQCKFLPQNSFQTHSCAGKFRVVCRVANLWGNSVTDRAPACFIESCVVSLRQLPSLFRFYPRAG